MKTLLILAAGMGSRFKGLKQIEPMGPHGEFIIDYSIYDAKNAGFDKVVFVIKKENYEIFQNTIGKRIEPYIETKYVFQDETLIPKKYQDQIKKREKPLGTAHAIFCAKEEINEPFAVINADDFYGQDAFNKASKYLDDISNNHYGMIVYEIANALSDYGSCTRGICSCIENRLDKITECKVEKKNNIIIATPIKEEKGKKVLPTTPVSMNFLLFSKDFFTILEDNFYVFLEENKQDLSKAEYQIPTVLMHAKKQKIIDIITTTAKWYGITYKEDKEEVKKAIRKMIEDKKYPQNLWKN